MLDRVNPDRVEQRDAERRWKEQAERQALARRQEQKEREKVQVMQRQREKAAREKGRTDRSEQRGRGESDGEGRPGLDGQAVEHPGSVQTASMYEAQQPSPAPAVAQAAPSLAKAAKGRSPPSGASRPRSRRVRRFKIESSAGGSRPQRSICRTTWASAVLSHAKELGPLVRTVN
jgi:hypothetical protein